MTTGLLRELADMNLKDLETRIDQLISKTESALRSAQPRYSGMKPSVEEDEWSAIRSGGLSFLESTFGRQHSYYDEFKTKAATAFQADVQSALGIFKAIRDEIKHGWIETTRGLVSAEVFADFLEMAEHLLDQEYKDPAAVLVGTVLEEHLRQLCPSVSVSVVEPSSGKTRKADSLNADLFKAGKYNAVDQKQVTAWLDLRNKAAHGKYSEYTEEQVRLMLVGVTNFMSRVRP
jgi:hypothetical protein